MHRNYLMFFLVCRNCERKKKFYQAHKMNLLLFLISESVSMIIVLICCKSMTIIFSKSHFLFVQIVSILYWKKTFQKILYTTMLDCLLRYVRSKSGRKLVLSVTVAYSCDHNLRTNYFPIVLFHLRNPSLETWHCESLGNLRLQIGFYTSF